MVLNIIGLIILGLSVITMIIGYFSYINAS